MVVGDPGGNPARQGPALLPPFCRERGEYIAYVSEQNLLPDESEEPLRHPQINEFFAARKGSRYTARDRGLN
jgi:heat shock protein HspQ